MKTATLFVCAGCLLLGELTAGAQVIPATPKKFGKRTLSGTGSTGGIVTPSGGVNIGPSNPTPSTKVRYTTHIALSEPRQWKSTDGKSLLGKLIAFEDLTMETQKGAPPPTFTPPTNPTVVKDGKARLLVDTKPYELALERLSQEDRDFVEKIRDAAAKNTARVAK